MGEMLAAGRAVYADLKNLIVWAKTNAGMGSLWRSQHELIFAWKLGSAPHVNNVELGKNGRWRSNVWTYAGANAFGRTRDEELDGHVTPKSVAMLYDAILDVTHRGDGVLDPFAGAGSTLVAAHKARRIGYGIEIDPIYVDTAVRRLEKLTKAPARHAETGKTFDETMPERCTASATPS
jgi:DNA modification methylase